MLKEAGAAVNEWRNAGLWPIPAIKTSIYTAGLVRRARLAAALAFGFAAWSLPPSAYAAPIGPTPLSPSHGQACNDLDKLAYDPAVGQIVCDGTSWISSVQPTGIRNLGTPCARSELDSVMASTPDGYLIFCPTRLGTWTLFKP